MHDAWCMRGMVIDMREHSSLKCPSSRRGSWWKYEKKPHMADERGGTKGHLARYPQIHAYYCCWPRDTSRFYVVVLQVDLSYFLVRTD